MSKFIVDSNFFIEAHRSTYPLDIFQSFWVKVKNLSNEGIIISIDKVKKEIYDRASHEDELKSWCEENLPKNFFKNTDIVIQNYVSIVDWVKSHHYTSRAIQEFLQTDLADP